MLSGPPVTGMGRLKVWRVIFGILPGIELSYVVYLRTRYGLGARANLTGRFPWGGIAQTLLELRAYPRHNTAALDGGGCAVNLPFGDPGRSAG